ncbi:MAG TPA: hypothetical protein VFL10_09960 [Ornithinibacter sp.]|nr:hypothetical protein [Ornithinibacter sp.]
MDPSILPPPQATEPRGRDDRDVRLAWACLVASPVAFLLAFVVGEGTSTLLGYDGVGLAPWWIATTTLLLATAVFCLPAVLATWFWHRARARGDDRAKLPAVILYVLSAAFVGLNLLAYLVGLLVEDL